MGEAQFQRFKDRALYVLSKILGYDATTLLPELDERNQRTASNVIATTTARRAAHHHDPLAAPADAADGDNHN